MAPDSDHFLTAKTDATDIVKGFDLGAVDYVGKPFNAHELLPRVKTHLTIDCLHRENERLLLESQRSFEDLRATQGVQWRNQQGTRSPEARILFGGSRWAPHHQALYPDAQQRQRTQGLLRGEPIRTTTEALAGSCQTCREFCPYHWVENAKRDPASSMRQV